MEEKIKNYPGLYQIYTLEEAFDLFNKVFFDGKLPHVIINQQRKKSLGYFSPNRWKAKNGGNFIHEINLSPVLMKYDDKIILAELLHQMVLLYQYCFGKASRPGYHNRECAEKMISVGLRPSSADGKITGQKIAHEIIKDGSFDRLINKSSFQIRYYSEKAMAKKKSLIKYVCPQCGNKVWGRPGLDFPCNGLNSLIIRN